MPDTVTEDDQMTEVLKEDNPYKKAQKAQQERFAAKAGLVLVKTPTGDKFIPAKRSASEYGSGLFSQMPDGVKEEIKAKLKK